MSLCAQAAVAAERDHHSDGGVSGQALSLLGACAARIGADGALAWDSLDGATAVFGLANLPVTLDALDALTAGAASRALHASSVQAVVGQSPVVMHGDPDMGVLAIRRMGPPPPRRPVVESDALALQAALTDGRMRLYQQPIVSAVDGAVIRWECLARMAREDGTIAGPADFIPAAERCGLIGALDLVTLELALDTLGVSPDLQLAVNVSAATIADTGARESYRDRLASAGHLAGRLTVEITETIAIHDLDVASDFAHAARRHGARLALDDFGEGHTSFRSLLKLPLDEVKIDGLYVAGIDSRDESQAFVRAIGHLARDLGLETVAERVETPAEARALKALGVASLQGYLYGQPEPRPV